MKQLFLFLLLLNAVFFVWQSQKEHNPVNIAKEVLAPDVQRLVLESELPDAAPGIAASTMQQQPQREIDRPPSADTQQNRQQETVAATAPAFTCYTLGPFADTGAAANAALMLYQAGVKVNTRETRDKVTSGYWVRLPVESSLFSAQRVVREIKDRNINDVVIVPLPGERYAISLGVFSKRAFAKRRHEQFTRLGYTPVTEERYRERNSVWLDINDAESSRALPQVRRDLNTGFPAISVQELNC